jgi:hypothetical protein
MNREVNMKNPLEVPDDFPRDFWLAGVSGAQSKLPARKIGDRYVVGPTEEELRERWMEAEITAQDLAEDTRGQIERGEVRELLPHYIALERGIRAAGWNVTPRELDWLMSRVRTLVESNRPDEDS